MVRIEKILKPLVNSREISQSVYNAICGAVLAAHCLGSLCRPSGTESLDLNTILAYLAQEIEIEKE